MQKSNSSVFFHSSAALSLTLGLLISGCVHSAEAISPPISPGGFPVFVQNVDPQAAGAVAAVDAFNAAMKAMDLEAMAEALASDVVILESGKSERSRDEYMGHHGVADALFMQNARIDKRYRKAQAAADFAWVATESIIEFSKDGELKKLHSTETMLLRKTESGWKIVHIHWSSRPLNPS